MAADFSITGEVKLNSDLAEKATSKWTVAAGQLIADFAKKAASSLKSVVKSGLDYNAQMESYLTNFKVMLGNEQLAAEKLEEIRRMAASTPFSLSDLTEGTQTLLQFGIAADDTTGVLKRLGDISLGNADKLQTLVRAYGKMSSAQKVTLENVNMMIDAGFNPLNQICDATGESMSALYKRISDGKVSFNELEAAVAAATSEGGQFYNGMLEASQTFNGRLSTLKDNVAALTGELTSGLFSALGDIIVKANELVVSITEDDAKMAALKDTIGVLTAAVVAVTAAVLSYKASVAAATAITALHTAATTAMAAAHKAAAAGATGLQVAQAALNTVLSANPIGLVVAALAALAAGLVTAYHTSETFRSAVDSAFSAIQKTASNVIGSVVDWINELVARIKGAAAALGSLKNGLGAAKDAYNEAYSDSIGSYQQSKRDKASQNRLDKHNERVAQSQADAASSSGSSGAAASATAAAASAAKSTKQATADIIKSISDTTTAVKDGVTTTTETVTETLSNGITQQKQVITSTSRQMVDGVLKDIKTVETIAADGKRTVSQTMETVRDVVNTVTATTTALADGIKTTTQTVTKTLADGTTEQQRVITQTQDKVIDGALRTVETVKTIAADGTEQVAETIRDSAAKTLDGLWKEIQDRANEGILGTVDALWNAVKSGDWVGIGKWVASTLYSGLTDGEKQQIWDFALSLVDGLNGVLGDAAGSLAQTAWSLGQTLFEGITGKFGDISSMAIKMGGTLKSVFGALKAPLAAAAKAISAGLSGGLLSMFPAIYAGFAGMIGTIGAAVEGMLAAISAALTSTLFGIPAGLVVAAAAVALGVAIAAIVSKLGGSHSSSGGSGGSGGGGSSGLDLDTPSITDGSNKLTDTIDANTAKLTEINKSLAKLVKSANALVLSDNMAVSSRVAASGTAQIAAAAGSYREGDTNITQNIYSKAHTAADLQREARWEADRAKAQNR